MIVVVPLMALIIGFGIGACVTWIWLSRKQAGGDQ